MILTTGYLRASAKRNNLNEKAKQERVRKQNEAISKRKGGYDIFLSNNFLGGEELSALVKLFNQSGYSVYADWQGEKLNQSDITADAARKLKTGMNRCKGLLYMTAERKAASGWCPWELGYFDGASRGRCCVFPILKEPQVSSEGEGYLGIYSYLGYNLQDTLGNWDFWVHKPCGERVMLSKWLAHEQPLWEKTMRI